MLVLLAPEQLPDVATAIARTTSFTRALRIPWLTRHRKRIKELYAAADVMAEMLWERTLEARGGACGVSVARKEGMHITVHIQGDAPIPDYVPESVHGFPIVIERYFPG